MRSFDWIEVPEKIGVNKTKAILKIKGSDYCCIITEISKSNVTKLLQNIDLSKKNGTLENEKNLFSYVELGKEIFNVWGYWDSYFFKRRRYWESVSI